MSALGAVRPESKEPERNRAPRVGKIARGFGDYTTGLNTSGGPGVLGFSPWNGSPCS